VDKKCKNMKKDKNTTVSFETFRNISGYEQSNLTSDNPTSFNGDVRIKKYRVTIEEIVESDEVYIERIQDLWDTCDNMHHWTPIENVAKSLGYELKNKFGNKRKDKY
jgi:hypothetical protein